MTGMDYMQITTAGFNPYTMYCMYLHNIDNCQMLECKKALLVAYSEGNILRLCYIR